MNPLVLTILLISGYLIVKCSNHNALVVFILMATFIPMDERLVIAGFDFYSIRVLLVFIIIRFFSKRTEMYFLKNKIDIIFVMFLIADVLLFSCREHFGSNAIANRFGFLFSNLFLYFSFRCMLHEPDDFTPIFRGLAILFIALAGFMFFERLAGRPIFTFLGGSPELILRDGVIRARGPFVHSSNAGIAAATSLPLLVYLFTVEKKKVLPAIGIIATIAIVYLSNSSTPLISFLFCVFSLLLWFIRSSIKTFKIGVGVMLVVFDIKMHGEIWDLMTMIGNITGGGGDYRSALIEKAFYYLNEWWLFGTSNTIHWTHSSVSETSADIANQYILYGVDGGLLTLILFIAFVVLLFRTNSYFSDNQLENHNQFLYWAIGSSLVGHIASFFCTSYFDQVSIFWYMLAAMIATMRTERDTIRNNYSMSLST